MRERMRAVFERRKQEWIAAKKAKAAARDTNPSAAGGRDAGVVAWVKRAWDATNGKAILAQFVLGVGAITLAIAFWYELASISPVIQPVSLPETLVKQGYSQDGMSAEIRAEVQKIKTDLEARADRTTRRAANIRSSNMQLDVQVPGATFSLRTAVRLLRDLLGLPDRSVSIDVRCRHDDPRDEPVELKTRTRTSLARRVNKPLSRPLADCNADRLWVKVIAQDAMGRGTMIVQEAGPIGADAIAIQIARLITEHYMPGMYAGSLLAKAQDAVSDGDETADFDAVRFAYDQAERFADRTRTWGERFIEQDWTERSFGGNWEEQKLLAQVGRVDTWLAEADMLLAKQQDASFPLEQARALAAEVIKKRPNYGLAHAAMGSALFRLKKPLEAMAAYEKGDLLDRGNFILHSSWANELDRLEFSDAEKVFGRKNAPGDEILFVWNRRVAAAQTDAVIHHHRFALDFAPPGDPSRSVLHSNLGYGLLRARLYIEALIAFDLSQRLDPGHGYELAGMGECLLASEKTDQALKVLRRALKRRPKDEQAMIAMARAQIKNDEAAEALRVIKRLPDSATAHYLAARAYEQLEKYSQARERYGKAVELVPEGGQMYPLQNPSELFREYARLLDPEAAAVILQRGIDANPKSVGARNSYAKTLIRLGRWKQAEDVLNEAVKLDRGEAKEYAEETDHAFGNAYADLALVHAMRNHVELALEAVEAALRLNHTIRRARCVKAVLSQAASEPNAGVEKRTRDRQRLLKC